jgi:hypothetical protein
MSCTTIAYANRVLTTTDMRLRFVPLALGNRIPPLFSVTTTALAAAGAETLTVSALPVKLWPGDVLTFTSGARATVADIALLTETTVKVVPLIASIASGEIARTTGSCYVAVTEAAPTATPKIEDATNTLSGTASESVTVASNYQLQCNVNLTAGSPGDKLLLDILYDKNYLRREIYAELTTPEGQVYKGACIPTTGTQAGAVQAKRTLQVTLQFQGCSFDFVHGSDAAIIAWPGDAPRLILAEGTGSNVLSLIYDRDLDPSSVPSVGAFTPSAGTIQTVAVSGRAVRLTLAANAALGTTVSYSQLATNELRGVDGVAVPSFAAQAFEEGPVPLVFTTRTANIAVDGSNNYTITTPTFATSFILGDLKIPGNADGWVSFDIAVLTTNRNVAFGFDSEDTNKNHLGAAGYDRYFSIANNGVITPGTDGAPLSPLAGLPVQVGDIYRLRRTSSVVTIDRSRISGLWETIYTWAGTYDGDIFINAAFSPNGTQFTRPRIKGGVAK